MKNILIVTPIPEESVSAYYTNSLAQSVKIAERNNLNISPLFLRDSSEHMVVNMGITLAHDEKLDGVVFINREVFWNPENLMELCRTNKDAVAIPVFDGNAFTLELGEISRLEEDDNTGEIKVQSASIDFIYLSSRVISKLCETHPDINYGGRAIKAIMQGAECFNQYFSSSDLLAYRLKEIGYSVWVNPAHNAYKASRILQTPSFSEGLKKLRE